MAEYVLAADLGGTNIRVAAVDPAGSILYQSRSATPETRTREPIVQTIAELARECITEAGNGRQPAAFGLAAAALVNSSEGRVFSSPNLPDLDGFPLAGAVSDAAGVSVILENDATAAAIGEAWLGASRNVGSSICITLGTGVGGGIILDGRPLRGIDGTAAEIGHICVEPRGVSCGCGSFGCLEQYASATAITRMADELAEGFPLSVLSGDRSPSSRAVFDAGIGGDELALEVFRRAGFYLGTAIAGLVNVLNPEMIVIAGGAAAGWELLAGTVRQTMMEKAFQRPAERVKLVPAELGDNAGILGAAQVALQHKPPFIK